MRSRKRSNLKLILVVLLLTISLGYAFLKTDLTINGTSKINATSWNVYFDNVQITTGSTTLSEGDQIPTINPTTLTDITYTVTLKEPGDFYEFTVDVVNSGTLDAMIGTITNKLNNIEITTLPAYMSYTVTYSDDIPIAVNHLLEAGESETYKIRLSFRTDINPSDLPTEGATHTLSFGVSYVQADDNAISVPHPVAETVYMANMNIDGSVNIGSVIPNNLTQYETAAEAMAALTLSNSGTNVPFYLKHSVVDGVVTESYVEFIITNEMATENPEMTAGTYALRGLNTYVNDECVAEYWDSTNNVCLSPYYASNVATLQAAFGTDNCGGDEYDYDCSVSGLDAYADSYGNVRASVGGFNCYVSGAGASDCVLISVGPGPGRGPK